MPPNKQSDGLWRLEFGARPVPSGGVEFRVWAPLVKEIAVKLKSPSEIIRPMDCSDGVFTTAIKEIGAGADYVYVIDGKKERPDPVSRFQPEGVHGPSRVVDPDGFKWNDVGWKGIALEDYVIYEFHIGTFTAAGTFASVIEKLGYLRDSGITAIEIMPVAQFPGSRNWGYDGVYPYAVQSSYGGPEELKRLIDAAHRAGLAVIMDVVYNHLGPEGNYLPEFMPCFSGKYKSPWGEALNYDGPYSYGMRRYMIDNSLCWLSEYHIDALRLDAVHSILDFGAKHLLAELSEKFHDEAKKLGRKAYLIAESDLDDVRVITSVANGGWGMDAQWNDAFHHAVHTAITGDHHGYFLDYAGLPDLRKAIVEGYVYDWRFSKFRKRFHGSSSKERPGSQFVVFTQNHDQVANALAGKRPATSHSIGVEKAAAALMICAPNLPMFFMGQEYGASTIFTYFTDFQDRDLANAVSEGRKKEYEGFLDEGFIDPQSQEAFDSSKLDWREVEQPRHQELLKFHRELLALRKRHKCLSNCRKDLTSVEFNQAERWITIERRDDSGERALIVCNLDNQRVEIPIGESGALKLVLFGGEGDAQTPAAQIESHHRSVTLDRAGVAIYLANV
ncbi:MAG TPA: malto-oligosyltrehalose trehalohydrolase [Candidatus Binataceae bacterium]|nr:malto-oligosyltrehalose trehalohydrolase [Candidatus Binataceae bacterium]